MVGGRRFSLKTVWPHRRPNEATKQIKMRLEIADAETGKINSRSASDLSGRLLALPAFDSYLFVLLVCAVEASKPIRLGRNA